jgi:hypothetical protein
MRLVFVAAVMACAGCGLNGKQYKSATQAITCDTGQTAVYTNRFTPESGGSGVATGEDAAAGKINSDPTSGGGGAPSPGAPSSPPSTPPPSDPSSPPVDPNAPITAMVATCGDEPQCGPGEVAIELAPAPAGGGGVATGAAGVDDVGGAPTTPPPPADPPAPIVKCAPPPPPCQPGYSPQFTGHDTWECTDCALVVTYGGIYGNYRRCVNEPNLACPDGQVPTWDVTDEIWQCKPTCDNGMYDQHTIKGELVCVPC